MKRLGQKQEGDMTLPKFMKAGMGAAGALVGVAAASYGACAGATWLRYGRPAPAAADEADELLDRFMPTYDVVERHHLHIDAPADVTYAASTELDLQGSATIRAIFKARELAFGLADDRKGPGGGLVALTSALGWRVLTEVPGREIVVGAVTQPWIAKPVFRGLPPEQFVAFAEPGYVKILWTLRADPLGAAQSVARTETRAVATDPTARAAFRKSWACVAPGVWLIRDIALHLIKTDAEGRDWRAAARTA
jgi:hypothetical protein